MNLKRIEQLAASLPDNSPYFWNVPVRGNLGGVTTLRYAKTELDPAFGWNFVKAFVQAGEPLPYEAVELPLRRAYEFLIGCGKNDRAMNRAVALTEPIHRFKYNVLRVMLICPNIPYEKIADRLGLTYEIVHLFEQLFWNVRDRRHEETYINHLAWPEGRGVELIDNYLHVEDPFLIALRSALNYDADAALAFCGLNGTPAREHEADAEPGRFKAMALTNANYLARLGGLNQRHVAGISHAKGLIIAAEAAGNQQLANDDMTLGVTAVSATNSILDHITRLQAPDLRQQMEYQQQLRDKEHAEREAQDKQAAAV